VATIRQSVIRRQMDATGRRRTNARASNAEAERTFFAITNDEKRLAMRAVGRRLKFSFVLYVRRCQMTSQCARTAVSSDGEINDRCVTSLHEPSLGKETLPDVSVSTSCVHSVSA
jgi:hypothetical protein